MPRKTMLAAAAAISASLLATTAPADTVINPGTATLTFDSSLEKLGLTVQSPRWKRNEAGDFSSDYIIVPSAGQVFEIPSRDGGMRSVTASPERASYTLDGGKHAFLKFGGGHAYISASDAEGKPIETFARAWILPQFGDDAAQFSQELRDINFVPTEDPLVWADFKDPAKTHSFTAAQSAFLKEVDNLRQCCTHSLDGLAINTRTMTVEGMIDGVAERDINFDGIYNEADKFSLFKLVETDKEGVYALALTDTMAAFMNLGFSKAGFQAPDAFVKNWGNRDGALSFAGGDTVGTLTFSY